MELINVFLFFVLTVSRHHQDTVSLNSYSNNKVCSSLPIKNAADIYDTRNLDNNDQENNCDQTVYYPSIYATDPLDLGRLAVQQVIPNFLNTNLHLSNNLTNMTNKTENNYHESNESNSNNICNSLGAILNANTMNNGMSSINNCTNANMGNTMNNSNNITSSNCIHTTTDTEYDFVDPHSNNQFCMNKNCTISSVLNGKNDHQMNTKLMNVINSNTLQTNGGCMIGIDNRNSSHVYDIPHRQQALNELNKLKQMSTFGGRNGQF